MLLHCQGALFNFLGIATLKDFTNPQTLNNINVKTTFKAKLQGFNALMLISEDWRKKSFQGNKILRERFRPMIADDIKL